MALTRDMQRRLNALEDAQPLMAALAIDQQERVRDRFVDQEGPGRRPWTPLSPVTIEKREKDGLIPIRILSARGDLAGSITYRTDGRGFTIGTDGAVADYAAIHQFGGKAGRGKKVEIPARPFLGFDDQDLEILQEELIDWLENP
ncbi:phage virion morphogenesis protein [Loktanella sp. 3ANDIMAR09]|uniref:phage virion morphogenesis protein n=1 Tax=Loktanella sp. 3ANDIMAR09 TaxID=1225657 RepID=UPI00155F14DD|nr:phage virion morphogenesis protein [Loktanella sp. 3ANDIMAR09]